MKVRKKFNEEVDKLEKEFPPNNGSTWNSTLKLVLNDERVDW